MGGGAHCHFTIDFWGKIIEMAKNGDTFFSRKIMAKNNGKNVRHFCHHGENG